jgi:hypothetical protein
MIHIRICIRFFFSPSSLPLPGRRPHRVDSAPTMAQAPMLYMYNTSPSKISLPLKYEALIIEPDPLEPTLTFYPPILRAAVLACSQARYTPAPIR